MFTPPKELVNKVRIKNTMGLHTRPATAIVKMLQNCKSDVCFTYKKTSINAKSILSILTLAARRNTVITIKVSGADAHEVMDNLVTAFENKFGE